VERLRHQFLSRAGLAHNKHGHVLLSGAANPIEQRQHGGVPADHSTETVGGPCSMHMQRGTHGTTPAGTYGVVS